LQTTLKERRTRHSLAGQCDQVAQNPVLLKSPCERSLSALPIEHCSANAQRILGKPTPDDLLKAVKVGKINAPGGWASTTQGLSHLRSL